MRLVFLGSPAFAVPSLAALVAAGHDVALVVTQPDRPAGRGQRLASPPVAEFARAQGLDVWQTPTLRGPEAADRLRALTPDAMALAAFAALVPRSILDIAPHGILNVHPSLLPRWRGASPIQAALLAGDLDTGVSIIRLVQALDAGPILLQQRLPIAPEDDYLTLEPRLAALGATLLLEALSGLAAGTLTPLPQDDSAATVCGKIERQHALIDWSQPATTIWHQVRAYRAWPQAYTIWQGKLLKVLRATPLAESPGGTDPLTAALPAGIPFVVSLSNHARESLAPGIVLDAPNAMVVATGAGLLRLDEVVLEGKRPQLGADFRRGYPSVVGTRLGSEDRHSPT